MIGVDLMLFMDEVGVDDFVGGLLGKNFINCFLHPR